MKFSNVFWGVILIFLGVLFILQNLGMVFFDWRSLWRLWPVILVLWGISILPAKSWIKLGLTLLVLAGTLVFMFNTTVDVNRFEEGSRWWNEPSKKSIAQSFTIPFNDTVATATLDLDAAAGSFIIRDSTNKLLEFDKRGSWVRYSYVLKTSEDNAKVIIQPESSHHILMRNHDENDVNMSLNTYPVWDINLDVGASSVKFDLSSFKIKNLDVDAGAASFKIKLGDYYPKTNINIDAGASSIKLQIPEQSGCDLKISTVLSGKTIQGFERVERGHYRTENFENSKNKIFISVDAAVSSYTITRY
ncbi:MAG TPA: hypothetical protein ENH02_04045 [Bacteroidetes bacterium]|nr:hypothetical protein [Bacteroidota bacterium]